MPGSRKYIVPTNEIASGKRWSWASFIDKLSPSMLVGLLLPDGTLMHANQAWLDVIGAKLEDVAGMPFDQTPWWGYSKGVQDKIRAALDAGRRGASSSFEFRIKTVHGHFMIVDFSLRAVFDDQGKVACLVPSACDVTQRHRAEQRLCSAVQNDVLTGLPNRRSLLRQLDKKLEHFNATGQRVAVLGIDIDRFSRVNGALGNASADAVLQAIASRISACLPEDALLARFDGDQFVIVLSGPRADGDGMAELASALLKEVSEVVPVEEREIVVTASIGIALADPPHCDSDGLLRCMAAALDRAKKEGRQTCVLHEIERWDSDPQRFELEGSLRRAIERDEFRLVYQPRVAIASGEIVGVEALLRWEHPVHGSVSPARFIPIAEEAGIIDAVGDWVVEAACVAARRWQREGLPPVRMTVNVSARQLRRGDLAARIERILASTGLDPCRFGIELTDTVPMQHVRDVAPQFVRLRSLGVEIALDDFGTGYSSLSCLHRLPFDAVKIDSSLVPAVTAESDALPIVRAIIAMAHCLGMKVVAEGVESEAQFELLAANHCDEFQGLHFSAPVPLEQVEAMLRANRRFPVLNRRRAASVRAIMIVDDERWVVERLTRQLTWRFGETIRIEGFVDPQAALRRLREIRVDVLVSDLLMPVLDGMSLMKEAKSFQPNAVRIMLLGPPDLQKIIEDERQVDVFRYLSKPWSLEQLHAHFDAAMGQVGRVRAERLLAEGMVANAGTLSATEMELFRLEDVERGITSVARGSLDEVLLPSQMMTLPGDLWSR